MKIYFSLMHKHRGHIFIINKHKATHLSLRHIKAQTKFKKKRDK